MGELSKWGSENSKYHSIPDGQMLEGIFKGAQIVPSNFDPTKKIVSYQIDDKIFNSGSRKLASLMDPVPIGSRVQISREGQQTKTRYYVKVVG